MHLYYLNKEAIIKVKCVESNIIFRITARTSKRGPKNLRSIDNIKFKKVAIFFI